MRDEPEHSAAADAMRGAGMGAEAPRHPPARGRPRPRLRLRRGTFALVAGAIAVLLVIAWAWIDGGREPLRTIVVPVRPQLGGVAPR